MNTEPKVGQRYLYEYYSLKCIYEITKIDNTKCQLINIQNIQGNAAYSESFELLSELNTHYHYLEGQDKPEENCSISAASGGHVHSYLTIKDLKIFADIFKNAMLDKDFKILTNQSVTIADNGDVTIKDK